MPINSQPNRKPSKKKVLRPLKLMVSTNKQAPPARAKIIRLANEFIANLGISNTSVVHLLNNDRLPSSPEKAAELKAVQKLLLDLHLIRRVKSESGTYGYYIVRAANRAARMRQNRLRIEELLSPAEQRLITYREILKVVNECNQSQWKLPSHQLHDLISPPYHGTITQAIQFLLNDGALRAKGYDLFITEKGQRYQNTDYDRFVKYLESDFFMDRVNRFFRCLRRRVVNYKGL